jgi:hypothetical protein
MADQRYTDADAELVAEALKASNVKRWDAGKPVPAWCALASAALDALAAAGRLLPEGASLPEVLRGDGPCDDCGTAENIIWFTESVFWNAIMRPPGYERDGILCIPCFVKRADDAGYAPNGWMLLPQWHWEAHAEREARRGPIQDQESTDE